MQTIGKRFHQSKKREGLIQGFSLAETLMVVAILIVLMGVGFIALIHWRTQLRQLELDATAKEIYMAAQNHLSFAESQGFVEHMSGEALGTPDEGYKSVDDKTRDHVYYFMHNSDSDRPDSTSVLGLMLPYGSIDETVRAGGSYIICYQQSTAMVLEVFYVDERRLFTADGMGGEIATEGDEATADYSELMSLRGPTHKADRQNVTLSSGKSAIVGYFGGEGGDSAVKLDPPSIKVENADKLKVTVTNPASNVEAVGDDVSNLDLKLIVEQEIKESVSDPAPQFSITLDTPTSTDVNVYEVVLDDVTTKGGGFTNIPKKDAIGTIFPGENIKVQAVVSGNAKNGIRATAARSASVTTNSLFATAKKGAGEDAGAFVITITSYRHLENLFDEISNFSLKKISTSALSPFKDVMRVSAYQTTDLSWKSFKESTDKENNPPKPSVYFYDPTSVNCSKPGTFMPVTTKYDLSYNGTSKYVNQDDSVEYKNHQLLGVEIDIDGTAAIFQESTSYVNQSGENAYYALNISNLEVVNPQIKATGDDSIAGSIIGKLNERSTLSNVLVRTTLTDTSIKKGVQSAGVAGGLAGFLDGGTIQYCASAIYVDGKSDTGGLVGKATGGTIRGSYSAGHTGRGTDREYDKDDPTTAAGRYLAPDVTSDATAGGLVGSAEGTSITNCYSTCSVQGDTAGGLAGDLSGSGSVESCYVTGRITASTDDKGGAFAGKTSGVSFGNDNYYYEIINIPASDAETNEPMGPFGSGEPTNPPIPFDVMVSGTNPFATFNKVYTGGDKDSGKAIPYDKVLASRYLWTDDEDGTTTSRYPLKTIQQLDSEAVPSTSDGSFTDHLTRHYGDWPMPETLIINTPSS